MLRIRCLAILAGLIVLPTTSHALESAPVTTAHTTATLLTNTDAVQSGQPFEAGLRLVLAPGWHTYWKNPGDAGFPVTIAVSPASKGLVGPLEWPAPQRIAEGDLTTFGYRDNVTFPMKVTPDRAPVTLAIHASWLTCHDICVPGEADLSLDIPAGQPIPSPQAPAIAAAVAQTPSPAPFKAVLSKDGMLHLSGPSLPADTVRAEFFPDGDGQTETLGMQPTVDHGGELTIAVALRPSPQADGPATGVISLVQASGAIKAYTISASPGSAAPATQPLLLLLAAALAGGLLLNLMPCVFPVLAMKAMALARLSGADRRIIRAEAGSYSAGVIAAFIALGASLVALRSAGHAAGWGFQFQSPVFVTAVAWLLFVTGLNMSGVFAVGEGFVGVGQSWTARRGHAGSFFTGLLAVVVATPCTVSFMGAAVAGALAASWPSAMLVFATMGLGLSLPYTAMAVFPRLASLLPRPGRWMATLRQILAFPMYGAAAWLVWVVSQQTGPAGVLSAGVGLVAVGFAAWATGLAQQSSGWSRRSSYAAAALGGVAAVALLTVQTAASTDPSEPFTPARLAELRQQGRPVFVNMTAAWCLSCLVNERLALSPTAVRRAFAAAHVAYLKGDWTRRDPAISTYLRDHDRDGVPLYVFYAPGQAPVVLPQLLSEGDLLARLAKLPG